MANGSGSDVVGHFQQGLEVLKRHPIIILPPLLAQGVVFVLTLVFIIGGVATAVVVGGMAGMAGALMGILLVGLLGALLSLVASGVVTVMARDALAGREPSIGDALNAVMARLVDVLVASILVMLIVGVLMLALVLPGIAAAICLMFTLPALLLDNLTPTNALKRSFTLVRYNLGSVVGLIVGWIVAMVAVAIISRILGIVPFLGHLAQAVLLGAAIAYLTVVMVRVYQTLPRR